MEIEIENEYDTKHKNKKFLNNYGLNLINN